MQCQQALNREQVMEILPHRDPMLLIDSVSALTPGVEARASFYVDPDRDIFRGHFPGNPVFPGVYTVEAAAQATDLVLMTTERYRGKVPLFLGIKNASFLKMIAPGDTIGLHATMVSEREDKAIATCMVEVQANGSPAARVEVTIAMR